jgi:branched-chain amino acid aminotransferase
VKDLDEDGRVVPAGFGRANWPGLLKALRSSGYQGFVSLEPHLLRAGRAGGFTGPTLFAEAHRALQTLITSNSVRSVGATIEGDGGHTSLAPTKYPHPTQAAWATRGWPSIPWVFLACVDGQVSPPDEVGPPATVEGILRADGGSEVVQVYRGRPIELDRHMDRLARACEPMVLDFPRDEILGDLAALLEEAGPVDCLWRIHVAPDATRLHLLEWLAPANGCETPLTLKTARYQPTVLPDFKAMSDGATMAASMRARNDGADELLVIHPDGTVLEPATASVFWARDGVLKASALESGIRPLITRVILMEALETREVSATLDELFAADEVFLASTSRQVRPVRRIDDIEYEEAPGPLCRAARRALERAIAGETTFSENER